jgi:hypothetical protein
MEPLWARFHSQEARFLSKSWLLPNRLSCPPLHVKLSLRVGSFYAALLMMFSTPCGVRYPIPL